MYLLYSLALGLALLVSAPFWVVQMARHGKYRAGMKERLGRLPQRLARPAGRVVWVHAVSVGEVLAVSRLVEELRREYTVYVSTTTATGQKLARERFGEERVFYFPLDFAFAVRSYLRALRPELVVLAETEFWPNFLRLAKAAGARVAVVNARISDRSLPGYRGWKWFVRRVLANVDLFLAQTEEDAQRLAAVGAPGDRVATGGNLKYDIAAPQSGAGLELLRRVLTVPREELVVAGSTTEGEEEHLLAAHRALLAERPNAVLVLAPRHPERFDAVARLLAQCGLAWWRRSRLSGSEQVRGGVLLLDTIGELAAVYGLGSIAFVGGSLAPRGGHNILEPAQHGVAVLTGPYTENFRDLVETFRKADAVRIVSEATLAPTLLALVRDPAEREALAARAREVAARERGATARTLAALRRLMEARA